MFILFEDLVENRVLAPRIVHNEKAKRYDQENRCDLADLDGIVLQILVCEGVVADGYGHSGALERGVICTGNEEAKSSHREEPRSNLADGRVEFLTLLPETAHGKPRVGPAAWLRALRPGKA